MRSYLALVVALVGGCGQSAIQNGGDGGRELPDGFLQTKCMTDPDCDDGNPCTIDQCSQAQGCLHSMVNCTSAGDACNDGYCDPSTPACTTPNCHCRSMVANEGKTCSDTTGNPGTCMNGTCTPLPQCRPSVANPNLYCGASFTDQTLGMNVIDTYGCPAATGLTGPETYYTFSTFNDQSITVTLSNVAATVDLELVVLDGTACVASAPCETTSVGTGSKSVTFTAKANQPYLIVVDGVNGGNGSYTLALTCNSCKPIQTLSCNQTIMGNTTGPNSTMALSSYPCAASEPGPEDAYTLTPTASTNYKIKLTGLTQDLDLIVIDHFSNTCDNSFCEAYSTNLGAMDEQLSFNSFGGGDYNVIVDSKSTGGPYTLEVDCPPTCTGSLSVDCNNLSDSRRNDDVTYSTNLVTAWGACDTMTTGPEVVYQFYATATGTYTFTLTGLQADLDLLILQGTGFTCDPTNACMNPAGQGTNTGTADETVTINAVANTEYFVAVDGKNGAVSPYTLKVRSTQCPGPSCYNGANVWSCAYLEDTRRNDDPARSTNNIDQWACDANTTGPEVVYPFTPPANGMYTVTLDGLTANLDLIVLNNTSPFVCSSSSACLNPVGSGTNTGTASESVTFAADTSHGYFIAVDGVAGAVSPYHLMMTSSSCPAPICRDGFDALSCTNISLTNRNDASGSTSDVTSWGTCDTGTNGPEFVHMFTPPSPGSYTIEMIGLHDDLDLIVQETSSSSPMCSVTAACFASSVTAGTADEKVTFTTTAGHDYWIIVDGKNGAVSRYTLAITNGCP
jgi:hypothetical protein